MVAVLWRVWASLSWRDLPKHFGSWHYVFKWFRDKEVRLQLDALAYNLGSFLLGVNLVPLSRFADLGLLINGMKPINRIRRLIRFSLIICPSLRRCQVIW